MCRKPRQRHDDEPLAVALEQSEPLELVERVADIEVDVDAEGRAQPVLDAPIELRGDWRRSRFMQEMIGEERLFDLLLFGGADDVIENAGVVVDVAIVDVVGQLDLVLERLPLVAHPLGR